MARRADAVRLYAAYAGAFLGVTLLSGVWLRSAFVQPGVLGRFSFGNLLHAHSHLAFFGWAAMALFALLAAAAGMRRSALLRTHAHLTGVASAAAFLGFLHSGYTGYTIAIAALHVLLWAVFAFAVGPALGRARPSERRFYRGALAFLLLAGAGAMLPGLLMARGVADAWLNQLAVQTFLTPFLAGWLVLGAMGAVYARTPRARWAMPVFGLTLAGALPSLLLHTTAAPPAAWLLGIGRAGTLLLGVAALLFALDVLGTSRRTVPLLRLAGVAAAGKGVAEVLAALGVALPLLASRNVGVAYLHLVLLGLLTPVLLAAVYGLEAAARRVAVYTAGLATMLGALAALGWPALGSLLFRAGLGARGLFVAALAGGAACALAAIALLLTGRRPARLSAVSRRARRRASESGRPGVERRFSPRPG